MRKIIKVGLVGLAGFAAAALTGSFLAALAVGGVAMYAADIDGTE